MRWRVKSEMRSTHQEWTKSGEALRRRWEAEQHLRGVGRFEYAELEERALWSKQPM